MMDPKSIIDNLQKKPYETRVRILWGTVALIGVALIIIWVFSLHSSIKGLTSGNSNPAQPHQNNSSTATASNFASVERIEATPVAFKIYFNINNTTDDILSFATTDNIELTVNNQSHQPTQLTDRQGAPFVQKILSHTQNFGIMVFAAIVGDTGTLTLDQMSLEQNADQMLKQDLNLNFRDLKKSSSVRN